MLGTATTNKPNKYEHFVRTRRAAIKGKEEESLCLCVTGGFNAFKSIFSASMAHSNFRLSVLHRKHWMERNMLGNLCQVYFMLMKLRSLVVGTRKSSNVHDQTACFRFNKRKNKNRLDFSGKWPDWMSKDCRQSLDIGTDITSTCKCTFRFTFQARDLFACSSDLKHF